MSGNTLRTYSYENVLVVAGGRITGFWEGDDAVSVEQGADLTSALMGAGGDALISVSTDQSAMVKLKLQHTGDGHALLTQIAAQYPGNPEIFPCSVIDTGTGDGGSAPQCVIMKEPTKGFGSEASVREWTIFCSCWTDNQASYIGA